MAQGAEWHLGLLAALTLAATAAREVASRLYCTVLSSATSFVTLKCPNPAPLASNVISSMKTATSLIFLLATACQSNDQLASEVHQLRATVDSLRTEVRVQQLVDDFSTIAYLTPGAEGYSVLDTDLGKLTVNLANVEPYANGSRVMLQFGNTTSATINGVTMTVEWGQVDSAGVSIVAGAKTKTMTLSRSLRGGAWSSIPLVLEGTPPQNLGFVRIRDVHHTGINLFR